MRNADCGFEKPESRRHKAVGSTDTMVVTALRPTAFCLLSFSIRIPHSEINYLVFCVINRRSKRIFDDSVHPFGRRPVLAQGTSAASET